MKTSNLHSKLKKRREPVKLLILPSAAMLLFISMIPLLMLIVFSFVDGNITTTTGISGFTLDNFKMAFSSAAVPSLMAKSFYIALVVTLLCIIMLYGPPTVSGSTKLPATGIKMTKIPVSSPEKLWGSTTSTKVRNRPAPNVWVAASTLSSIFSRHE